MVGSVARHTRIHRTANSPEIRQEAESCSEITEPSPIPVSAAEFHEPSAGDVENRDGNNPHRIHEGQPVAVAIWPLREVCNDRAMPHRLMERERNHNRD